MSMQEPANRYRLGQSGMNWEILMRPGSLFARPSWFLRRFCN